MPPMAPYEELKTFADVICSSVWLHVFIDVICNFTTLMYSRSHPLTRSIYIKPYESYILFLMNESYDIAFRCSPF